MNFKLFFLFALVFVVCSIGVAHGCQGHDQECTGTNGHQGSCCGGLHCQKNDPSWAKGRCYYNPGR